MPEKQLEKIKTDCNNKVRSDVGAFARLFGVIIVNRLPKTRSGKIVRGTIKKIVNKMDWKMPATIDDPATLDEIRDAFQKFFETLKPE